MLLNFNVQSIVDYVATKKDVIVSYCLNILVAILVLWIGLKLIRVISSRISKQITKTNIDPTLRPFITTLVTWLLRIMLIISVAGMLGIQTTSFVAVLGAAGLAVGLALQGSLSNFAGGALLLIFRPYKVGDIVEIMGQTGHVMEIQIFNTILKTPTNKTIILPNGAVAGGTIVNFSTLGNMRADIEVVLSEHTNLDKAKSAIELLMTNHPLVLKDPKPEVKIIKFEGGDSRLNIMPYSHPDNYWTVYFDVFEGVKNLVTSEADISFPQPNIEVIMQK